MHGSPANQPPGASPPGNTWRFLLEPEVEPGAMAPAGNPVPTEAWQARLSAPSNRYPPTLASHVDVGALLGGAAFFRDSWGRHPIRSTLQIPPHDWPRGVAELAAQLAEQQRVEVCDADGRRSIGAEEVGSLAQVIDAASERLLLVRDAHRELPFAGELQRAFSGFFRCPVSSSLYLNAAGAPSFPEHHDAHHVFAVQLFGAKSWALAPPTVAFASRRYSAQPETAADPNQVRLTAGQWLYLPLGWRHRVQACDGVSVHITFGIHVPRWIDALEAMLEGAGQLEPSLRAPVPMQVGPSGVSWQLGAAAGLAARLEKALRGHTGDVCLAWGTPLQLELPIHGCWPIERGVFVRAPDPPDTALFSQLRQAAARLQRVLPGLHSVHARGSLLVDKTPETLHDLDLILVFHQPSGPNSLTEALAILGPCPLPAISWDLRAVHAQALKDGSARASVRLCLAVASLHLAGAALYLAPVKAERTLAQALQQETLELWHQQLHALDRGAPGTRRRVQWLQKRALRLGGIEGLARNGVFTRHPLGCASLCARLEPSLASLAARVCADLLARDCSAQAAVSAIELGARLVELSVL